MKLPAALRRASVIAYCAIIFYLSSRSKFPEVETWYPGFMPDPAPIAHFFLYAVLCLIAWNDFRSEPAAWLNRRAPLFAVIFCALYGLSDEYHQSFVPNRHCTLVDFMIDVAGAAAAMFFISLIRKRKSGGKIAKE
ncbi:MAG: VanZ family protein [bacterium]